MRIDVHTHLAFPDFVKHLLGRSSIPNAMLQGGTYVISCTASHRQVVPGKLLELDEKLKDMEAMKVDTSVLTHGIPGPELLPADEADDWASHINDHLASVVEKYPDKFIALGSIGFGDVQRSIAELDRCINQLGFKGIQLFSNIHQKVVDSPEFMEFYRHVAGLGVPMNMHPTAPLNVVGMEGTPLVAGMGFIYDTSLATMRLIRSGLFDQEPDLKLIVPHVGGILPYLQGRTTRGIDTSPPDEGREKLRHPSSYYLDKIYVDTVAHSVAALEFCYQEVGAQRMLYGTDHPFANYFDVAVQVEQLHCTEPERELIYHGNARRLLKLS